MNQESETETPIPANTEESAAALNNDASNAGADGVENPASTKADAPESPKTGAEKPDPAKEKAYRKEAKKALATAKKLFKRAKSKLSQDRQDEVTKAIAALDGALQNTDVSCKPSLDALNKVIDKRLKFAKKSSTQEVIESLLFALAFALVLRTFLVEPFKIPSRSMVPTLLEGDQLFVTKLSYGVRLPILNKYVTRFSDPARGEVIVFAFPNKEAKEHLARTNSGCLAPESLAEEKDYIKRIIGVEGDTIEVIDQVVYVNGEPVAQQPFYERTVSDYMFLTDKRREFWNREIHGDAVYTTITHEIPASHFGPVKVEPNHVFVMGDNRDNSADSRCWGQVPIDNIKGRAQVIWWSGGHVGPRWERMFTKIQ